MTEKKKLTREEAIALVEEKRLELAAKAKQATEVIPAPPRREWAEHDPACLVALIDAAIEDDGNIIMAAKRVGCPEDISLALQASGAWEATWNKRLHTLITQPAKVKGLKALAERVEGDGNAYTFKVMHDTAPKEDLSDDEKRRAAAFARMTPDELLKEIERREKVMLGFKERLAAGRAPPPTRVMELAEAAVGLMGEQPRGESAAPLDAP